MTMFMKTVTDDMKRLPGSRRERAAATGRMVLGLGRAGVQRLLRRSEDDEVALGELLAGELDRMKGLAMKVGQIVSYMEVGLPEPTQAVLARLQRGAQPLAPELVVAEVEAAFGAPIGELFDRFDLRPVAAASIGQVHRASFRGREVAVKVRYPGVRETLEADTRQLDALARVASLATAVDGEALVAALRERVLEECDYRREAEHQRAFGRILADDPVLVTPEVVPERCAEGVLTTAWCEGAPLASLRDLPGPERDAVVLAMARLAWSTLFRHGVLHADPHPGNFLVAPGPRLVVLDYGCVKRFEPARIEALRALFRCVLEGRRSEVMPRATAVGLVPEGGRADPAEVEALVGFVLAPYRTPTFRFERAWWERELARFRKLKGGMRHLAFPPDWMWIQRTLVGLHAVLLGMDVEAPLAAVAREALSAPLDPV